MKVLGFDLRKGEIRYSLLTGTKPDPILLEKERHSVLVANSTPKLLDWFETTFESILERTQPDKIAYRLSLEPKRAQMEYLIFPYALLNLIAYRQNKDVYEYISQNFTPSKFGLAKGVDVYSHCTDVFGDRPPHWDKNQKYSVLAAWLTLGN